MTKMRPESSRQNPLGSISSASEHTICGLTRLYIVLEADLDNVKEFSGWYWFEGTKMVENSCRVAAHARVRIPEENPGYW